MASAKKVITSLAQERAQRQQTTMSVVMAEINKEYGDGTMVRASDIIATPQRLSTGSLWFDLALGGGWPVNGWSEIVGLESSCKTALAYGTAATAMVADPAFEVLWCAAEQFDEPYAAAIGVDLNRLYVLEENTMEIVYAKVTEIVEKRAVDMVVIDAYPSLVTNAEDQAFIGDTQVSPGARLTGKFMRGATKATKRSLIDPTDRPFTGLFINQWREKVGVMFGDPRTTPGGKGKNFWMNARVELSRSDSLKDSDGFDIGQTVKLNVFKNKGAVPKRQGMCDFYFDTGVDGLHRLGEWDDAGGIADLGLMLDVVVKKGRSSYVLGDEVLGNSKAEYQRNVRAELDLQQRLRNIILNKELPTDVPQRPRQQASSRRFRRSAA